MAVLTTPIAVGVSTHGVVMRGLVTSSGANGVTSPSVAAMADGRLARMPSTAMGRQAVIRFTGSPDVALMAYGLLLSRQNQYAST